MSLINLILCKIGIHTFGKWGEPQAKNCRAVQVRVCTLCNKMEMSDIG